MSFGFLPLKSLVLIGYISKTKLTVMRYLTALFLLCTFHNELCSQLVEISLEPFVIHDGNIAELDSMATYHVAICTNPEDEISSVFGDADSPLSLTSTDGFYQSLVR